MKELETNCPMWIYSKQKGVFSIYIYIYIIITEISSNSLTLARTNPVKWGMPVGRQPVYEASIATAEKLWAFL